jgi:hypothetical protein
MKIKLGKYTLNSDAMCMWIDEEYETINQKTKKPTGKFETRRVAGYSTSLQNLLRSFRDAKVGGSDAESLEELIEVLRATYEDMERLYKCAVENDFKLLKEISDGKRS